MIKNKKINTCFCVYALCLLLCILISTFYFLQATINFANGNLQTNTISITDAQLINLQLISDDENGTVLYSESYDPQVIIENIDTPFINLQVELEFDRVPDEVILFYADSDEDFSTLSMAWATKKSENTYYFDLQGFRFEKIRIDATNLIASEFTIKNITANTNKPFWQYYTPTKSQIFYYIVYSGIVAAFVGYYLDEYNGLLTNYINKMTRKKNKHSKNINK